MRLRLGSVEHDLTTHTLVMGVLAPRPPSPGAPWRLAVDDLLARAERLVDEGADVLDLGGPPAEVEEHDELAQVLPAVRALAARFSTPVAIETARARVVAEACAAGAVVAGDRSAVAATGYLEAAADAGATVVATHVGGRAVGPSPDIVAQVRAQLAERVAAARAAGIGDDRIVVDGGLDLGKSAAESLALLRGSAALADLGAPLLLAASDKRFLGTLLDLEVDERRMASHAAHALGIARGCRILRATDVRGAKRVASVLEAILSARLEHVERSWPVAQEHRG